MNAFWKPSRGYAATFTNGVSSIKFSSSQPGILVSRRPGRHSECRNILCLPYKGDIANGNKENR